VRLAPLSVPTVRPSTRISIWPHRSIPAIASIATKFWGHLDVLRRLDCVLEATKPAVLKASEARKALGAAAAPFLTAKSGFSFYNISPMDFAVLQGDAAQIKPNLLAYVNAFSENVRDVFDRFDFTAMVEKLDGANLLFQIVQKFAAVDLHPDTVSNGDMGAIFEELIRRFAELSNETAGEHFTPARLSG
jgi:type I restriction enzyme M protein